ncbi:MAG: hypothetical protein H6R02_2834, partial [Burkholderiaceae bacterium]|nr:hypothetical protein [Burkholderiaceae bacterium]
PKVGKEKKHELAAARTELEKER